VIFNDVPVRNYQEYVVEAFCQTLENGILTNETGNSIYQKKKGEYTNEYQQ